MSCSRTTKQWGWLEWNPRPFGLESSTLPLSHCAPVENPVDRFLLQRGPLRRLLIIFLAHQIGISAVLLIWDNWVSYILYQPVGMIKSNSRTSKDKWRHRYVKVTSLCHMSHPSVFRSFWEPFSNIKMRYLMVNKKNISIILVRIGKINSSLAITVCHRSASLVMTISDPRDRFFYLIFTFMIDSYILAHQIGISVFFIHVR